MYLPSQRTDVDVTHQIESLQDLLNRNEGKSIILMGDLNAKSLVWGNPLHSVDTRGTLLLEFCAQNDMEIWNDSSSEATFSGPQGESWIDLAMG